MILDKLRGNFAGLTGGAGFDWVRPESVPPDRDPMVGAAKRWRNARGQRRRQLPKCTKNSAKMVYNNKKTK